MIPPSEEVLLAEYEAWIVEQLASSDPAKVLEIVMQCHLPLPLPDGHVMCLCHVKPKGDTIFTGPVFHRQHVAHLQLEALRAAGHI